MLVDIIGGNRPDIIRMASIVEAIQNEQRKGTRIGYRFIYTGRDQDVNLDKDLFEQLEISRPNVYLGISEPTEASNTAAVMLRYERLLANNKPDMVIVSGKNTPSMACAVTARKTEDIKIAVVNAGVRTGSNSVEETNRLITDSIAHLYFTASHIANDNLRKLGIIDEQLFLTGNTHIDSLMKASKSSAVPEFWDSLQLKPQRYYLVALNKPYNVGYPATFKHLLNTLVRFAKGTPIIMLVTPEVEKTIQGLGIQAHNLHTIKRTGYFQLCYLQQHAKTIITDSSSLQEEGTVLQTPTLTMLPYTDVPESVTAGTNELITTDQLERALEKINAGKWKKGTIPYFWDGKAAERVLAVLKNLC